MLYAEVLRNYYNAEGFDRPIILSECYPNEASLIFLEKMDGYS